MFLNKKLSSYLYYIIHCTAKYARCMRQATQNFTASLTPYQPSPIKIYSNGS